MLYMNGDFDRWQPPHRDGLSFSCYADVKNYDSEWEKLLDFLSPWALPIKGNIVGTYQTENDEEPRNVILTDSGLKIDYASI
jgi:hypothetical protein